MAGERRPAPPRALPLTAAPLRLMPHREKRAKRADLLESLGQHTLPEDQAKLLRKTASFSHRRLTKRER